MCGTPYTEKVKKLKVLKTEEFEKWLTKQQPKTRVLIQARIDLLSLQHFGFHKRFEGLIELKWKNGLLYTHSCGATQLLLLSTEEIKMANKKTSTKRSKSGMKSLKENETFQSDTLKDTHLVIETLLECIKENDLDSFREVLAAHLMTVNKVELAKKAGIGRRTIYDLLDPEKEFNPGLGTVSALIQAIAA